MNVSRLFLLLGTLYLLVGMVLGMYMGATQDFTLAPVHAHINLLGFALMLIFGLAYRVMPRMADGMLARAHFWLHQIGVLGFVASLYLDLSGKIPAASAGLPLAVFSTMAFVGILCWAVNLLRNT